MALDEHRELGLGSIHIAYNWAYADATARTSDTSVVSADLGKFARQLDNNTIWMLTATTPTWVAVGNSGGTPGGSDTQLQYNNAGSFGGISGVTTNGVTLTVNQALTWGDGVKQTFNPNGTNAGVNIGAHTADPSSLANGDVWYNSTSNELLARINGATVSWGAAPGFVTGTGTANQMAVWSSGSAIGNASILRFLNSRLGVNVGADPATTDGRFQVNPFPASGGGTINYGDWNSTGNPVVVVNAENAATNGGSSIASPFPALVLALSGVSGQSQSNTAALALTRYSTANTDSNTRLVIQANAGASLYPVDTMSFYGSGRAGIGNGTVTTSGNDAKALLHVGTQLVNAGTNYSTTAWGGGGGPLVPLMAVHSETDADSTTIHPEIVIAKRGVVAGQEAPRAELGVGRYESASNAPRTRMDVRLGHAVNETTPPRVASFMSYGGFGVGLTTGTDAANDNAQAVIQSGNTPSDAGSYSISNWNGSGGRVRGLFVTPNSNGGSSPASAEPALVLARVGVTAQAYSNYAEFKVARYVHSGTAARTGLTLALTHGDGDASGTDVLELRSDKSTLFKGQFGSPRVTTSLNGSQTYDFSTGNTVEITLTGNLTLNHSNTRAGSIYTVIFIQDGTGSRTLTLNSSIKSTGGVAPTLTTAPASIDILTYYSDGTNLYEISRAMDVK